MYICRWSEQVKTVTGKTGDSGGEESDDFYYGSQRLDSYDHQTCRNRQQRRLNEKNLYVNINIWEYFGVVDLLSITMVRDKECFSNKITLY